MAHELEMMIRLLVSFIISTVTSLISIKFIIKNELKHHVGQAIREDIVQTHFKKQGTPTMGGVGIVLGVIVGVLINFKYLNFSSLVLLGLVLSFFVIGFVDDYKKVKYKNSKGLSAGFRFSLEILLVMITLLLLDYQEQTKWVFHLGNLSLYLGPLFIIIIILMIVGSSNAVNMTDGLDGLAGGLLLLAYLPFLLLAIKQNNYALAIMITSFIGGNVGFLYYNAHPAKIFMGDAGSLTNGCFLAISAFLTNAEYLLLISGGIFIVETLSVILQVVSFKTTHHRIFKMTPIHHHFELKGMKEYQVVNLFYLVGFIFSFLAILIGGVI